MQTAVLLRCRRPLALLFRGHGFQWQSPADFCLRCQGFFRPISAETRPSEASAPASFSLLERAESYGDVHFDEADAKSSRKDETCISGERCVGIKQQLTLASLGFTEDGEELQTSKKNNKVATRPRMQKRVGPIKDSESKKENGKVFSSAVKDVKSKVDKGNYSDSTVLDQLVDSEPPLQQQVRRTASPEEMKRVALEASEILAKIAGAKFPRVGETRMKKITVKQSHSNDFRLSSDSTAAAKDCLEEKTAHSNVSSLLEDCSGTVEESEGTLEDTRPDSYVFSLSEDCSGDLAESKEDLEEITVDRTLATEFKHPWPEWIEFLQFLYAGNFFTGMEKWTEEGKSVFETGSCVRTASIAFSRDRGDIFRSLTKKDLKVIANYGCPSLDTKASNASKRLRTMFRIPEGEVCQRCSLKMSCPRAFLDPPKDTSPDPRTLDVVRIITGFAVNALPSEESFMSYPGEVETSVRRILQEILTFGALPRDPSFVEKAPEVQQAREVPSKSRKEKPVTAKKPRDDVMMKLGDWSCPNCNFMNFAKNKNCRECNVSRPPQQTLSGEWQCPKCRYVNFERNLQCRECGIACPLVHSVLGLKTRKDVGPSLDHERNSLDEDRTELHGAKKSSEGRYTGQNDNATVSDAHYHAESPELLNCKTVQRPHFSRSESSCSVGSHPEGMPEVGKCKGSSRSVSCNNVQKLNLSRRKVSIQQVLESDYEASQEETDSDSLDFLDLENSDSDMDLSGEEDEALSRLEFQVQGGKNSKAIFRWSEDEEAKANASSSQKGVKQMKNMPRSCKVSKIQDVKLSSSTSNPIGKRPSKGSVVDGKSNEKPSKATKKRDLKATSPGLQQASKTLFSWSDSDADDSDSNSQRNLQQKVDSRRKVFGSKHQHRKGKR